MATRYRRMAEGMAQDVIEVAKGNGNGIKRIGIILSVIVTSMVIGGFVFDWVEDIVKKDIAIEQNGTMIRKLQAQVESLQQDIGTWRAENSQFQDDLNERISRMDDRLNTLWTSFWKRENEFSEFLKKFDRWDQQTGEMR